MGPSPIMSAFAALIYLTSVTASPLAQRMADSSTSSSFDYVIVGSGPGGLVMANRLTEDPAISVAVVEAGTWAEDVTGNISVVPGYNLLYDSANPDSEQFGVDWGFVTTPQAGANGARMRYQRGKVLGGSTNLNAMAWSVSSQGAFAKWADEVGDASWGFDTVSKYYKKAANFAPLDSGRRANATPQYRQEDTSVGGPLDIRYPPYAYSWTTWLARALNTIGVSNTNSFISGSLNGSAWQVNSINHTTGARVSADTAYLRPFLDRPNLHLFQKTLAEKIVFSDNKTATGVVITPLSSGSGRSSTLRAKREVIISAGVFQSPQLLQISGIGPKAELEKHGIPCVADRPGVGQNIQDQFFFGLAYQIDLPTVTAIGDSPEAVAYASQWKSNGTGVLANPGGEYLGYERIPDSIRSGLSPNTTTYLDSFPTDWPEIEYETLPAFVGNLRNTPPPNNTLSYATILGIIQTQSSRGNVSLVSNSMHDLPAINPNWLTTTEDLEVTIAMFKRIREIWQQDVLQKNIVIGPEHFPGSAVQSDAEIEAFLRDNIFPIMHAVSSNKMGKPEDTMAVVDSNCSVYGVNRLRVVDASAFPFLPPGSAPQAVVYMLSEKVADDVKAAQKHR